MTDIIIRGASICRGEKPVWEKNDIAISAGRIERIGTLNEFSADREIDASGLLVTPGLIDIHGHSDFRIKENPAASSKVRQGITTEVSGNCGFSAAPSYAKVKQHLESLYPHLPIDWQTLSEYVSGIKETAINLVPLVGAGNIRASVLGYENIQADEVALRQMGELLEQAFLDGAWGLSFGLSYPTGVYADKNEIKFLVQIVKKHNAFCAVHMRSEGDNLLESISEWIDLALETGVSVQISHLKCRGAANFNKLDEALSLIRKARKDGADIWCDRYPFSALSAELDSVLPSWVYEGGDEEELSRLTDKNIVQKIKQELMDKSIRGELVWNNIIIAKTEVNAVDVVGKSIAQLSEELGKLPQDVVCDLLHENRLRVEMLSYEMSEDNMLAILSEDFVFTGTDSSVITPYNTNIHPRNFFSFPVGMALAQREGKGLEEFICRNTGLVAKRIGLEERGLLQKGYFADIIVWDPEALKKIDTDVRGLLYPDMDTGVKHVIINGRHIFDSSIERNVCSGKVLLKEKR